MILSLYKIVSWALSPLFHLHLKKRLRLGKENRHRLQERLGFPDKNRPEGFLVWIHGASVGESLSAVALMKRLMADFPTIHLMLTTGTVTSAQVIRPHLSERCFHQFIPMDMPAAVARFLDHWKPNMALWFESDLWPNMLMEIKKREISAYLINARLSEKSFSRWQKIPWPLRSLLKTFKTIYAQSEVQAKRFEVFGATHLKVLGNLKFSAAPLGCDEHELKKLREALGTRPVWLAASTHPKEEDVVMAAHQALRKIFPDMLTIIAPRHPHRGTEIATLFEKNGIKTQMRTTVGCPSAQAEVYMANTLGELGIFYRCVSVVFMGGSLEPHIGGHNIIEPAHFNCAILQGPHSRNFQETTYRFEAAQAVITVRDAHELAAQVEVLLTQKETLGRYAGAARALASSQHAALEGLMTDLTPELPHGTA